MSPHAASVQPVDGAAPRGFVLVGVVMFVLVLTILGLSLFTLSGFEAQFFARSNERLVAFNTAASGIERARFALMATDSLQPVWQRLAGDGLEYPVAVQGADSPPTPEGVFADGDSSGIVDWNGEDIWIRTVARAGQARVVLQARFSPHESDDYYKRLITARHIVVQKYLGGAPRWSQTYMSGAVRLSDPDTVWNKPPDAPGSFPLPRPPIDFLEDPLPLPQLGAYFAAKMPLAQPYDVDGAGHYTLDAGGGVGYFYRPPGNPGVDDWTVDENNLDPTITVHGTVVWLADPGIRFGPGDLGPVHKVHVIGNPLTDRLIIVTRPRIHPGIEGALNFEAGIISDVPMILVSDGKVRFDCQSSYNDSTRVAYLSIYANDVQIGGPVDATVRMDLMHTASLLPNQAEPIIDQLYMLGVLPSSGVGVQGRLTLDPGTWQERSTGAN